MRLFVRFTWLLPAVMLTLAACGGGDGDKADVTAGTDVLNDILPGETVVPDADALTEDKVTPPDVPVADETSPPPVCEPACDPDAGEYCDADQTCLPVTCTYCIKSNECGDGGICSQHKFSNGEWGSFCTAECTSDADCDSDRACLGDPKRCVPRAVCAVENCGDGAPGDPCAFDELVNGNCGECQDDLTCYGSAPLAQLPCETAKDCVLAGFSPADNPDCVDGLCGRSYCVGKCVDFDCSDGFEPMSAGLGNCVCIPVDVGTAEAGDPCPIWNVFFEGEHCEPGLNCLGIPAEAQEDDPEEGKCETSSDCDDYFGFLSAGDCVDGYCGTSFCSAECDDNAECEEGFFTIDVSDTCYCAPTDQIGDGMPGDPCPYGVSNEDADYCDEALNCFGINAEETVPCEDDSDCANPPYAGNATCIDGWCGTSFCSEKCNADDECDDGFEPLTYESFGIDKCNCVPEVPIGEAEAGEACPAFNVNTSADHCADGLECLGDVAAEGAETCTKAADCTAGSLVGEATCTQGFCASSLCLATCTAGDTLCADGAPYFYGECLCHVDYMAGDSEVGDACPLFTVNTDADTCQADLVCGGNAVSPDNDDCESVDDCNADDYVGVIECNESKCASSLCMAQCTDGECDEGFEVIETEADLCFCLPAA